MTTGTSSRGEIVLYQTPDGTVELDVRIEQENLWLNQKQMSELFDKDVRTINEHIGNVYAEGELERKGTIRKFRIVRQEGKRQVQREIEHYDLDVIISVGYGVKSQRGVRFRQWATRVLRDHILKGYSVNRNRLRDLNRAVRLVADTARRRDLSGDEAKGLLAVIGDYNRALGLLDDYDHQRVSKPEATGEVIHPLEYEEALRVVDRLRSEFAESDIFGVEKDKGLASALGAIMQTAGGQEVYPSLEEKAANLLYFLVKNHAFVDGNKRIAAALFLWFLNQNSGLDKTKLSEGTLVAMTLMIAESRSGERDILVRILTHLLCHGESR